MRHSINCLVLLVTLLLSACATEPSQDPDRKDLPSADGMVKRSQTWSIEGVEEVRTRPVTKVLDVWMLDVGQGACIYIVCPDGKSSVIIDCGTAKNGGATPSQISDWINAKNGQAEQVTLLVTHGHRDHISHFRNGGIDARPISKIMLGGGQQEDYPKTFHEWAKGARSAPSYFSPAEFKADDARFSCGNAKFDLLTVNTTAVSGVRPLESKENADSAVVRLSFAGHAVVFPGDAESVTEQSALENADRNGLGLAETSLLISSHHGADTGNSNSMAWLSRLKPHAGLFSANIDYATYTHPRCSSVQTFYAKADKIEQDFNLACGMGRQPAALTINRRLFSTFENGHVRARFSAAGVSYACQVNTPACDTQLAPAEMP
jgi:beta-lactamase superfamily II metal-dependent hydrolase